MSPKPPTNRGAPGLDAPDRPERYPSESVNCPLCASEVRRTLSTLRMRPHGGRAGEARCPFPMQEWCQMQTFEGRRSLIARHPELAHTYEEYERRLKATPPKRSVGRPLKHPDRSAPGVDGRWSRPERKPR